MRGDLVGRSREMEGLGLAEREISGDVLTEALPDTLRLPLWVRVCALEPLSEREITDEGVAPTVR